MSATDMGVKFACWVPNVSSRLVISKTEQRTSHDTGYDVTVAQIGERSGFHYNALEQVQTR